MSKSRSLTITALFVALTFILGLTPLGLIPLGFINVTILCIPVIIGELILGLRRGMILGLAFGLASTMSAFGVMSMVAPSGLASALVAANPFLAIVLCVVPRLLVPVVAHFTYKLVSRGRERFAGGVPAAAIAGSVTNTVVYLGLMLLFYTIMGIDSTKLLAIIAGTGLIAGGCEAAAAAIIATPVTIALWKVMKK